MTTPKKIKRGDLLPALEVELSYRDRGSLLDIPTSTPVVFIMRPRGGGEPVIDRAAALVTGSARGKVLVRYDWQDGDTVQAGDYDGEFEFDIVGQPLTAPSSGYIPIVIYPDLG